MSGEGGWYDDAAVEPVAWDASRHAVTAPSSHTAGEVWSNVISGRADGREVGSVVGAAGFAAKTAGEIASINVESFQPTVHPHPRRARRLR